MARKIEIEIVGDAKNFQNSLGKAAGSADSFGSKIATLGKVAAVGLAALGAGAAVAGKKIIGMASDAAEVQSKMEVVFGKTLPGLTTEIDKFSQATGTSRFAMREQAADMGALLAPMLGSKQGAADMSLQFVKLATDLGSFNNIPTGEALEKIRAGLVGESEPLRALGVLLTEATTKQWAYTHGIAAKGAVLTEVQKVEARAGQIMAQTSLAQGDATRTAGSMANQLKMLKSNISDAATELGTALLPAALAVVQAFNNNWPQIKEVAATVFDALQAGITAVVGFFRTHWDTIKSVTTTAIAAIKTTASGLTDWFENHLQPTFESVARNVGRAWKLLQGDMDSTSDKMADTWQRNLNQIKGDTDKSFGEGGALGIIKKRLQGMLSLVNSFLALLRGDWSTAWAELTNAVKLNLTATFDTIKGMWSLILGWLGQLGGKIAGLFADAGRWLYGAGTSILQGLWDGLKSKWEAVAGWLGGLGDKITGLKGPESKDATLLVGAGKAIILGLETGMMASWSTLAPKINALGGQIIHNFILGIGAAQPQFTGKLGEAAQQALERARTVVEGYQAKFATAFGNLGEHAKRAFEAKTQNILDNVAKRFDAQIGKWQAFAAALTPAEKALASLDAAEQKRAQDAAVAAAAEQMAKAQAMAEGAERDAAILAAMEAMRQAELTITRAKLEEQAAIERAAREAQAATHIAALEATKARELQNLEERRSQLGAQLDAQLATLQERLSKHPEEYNKIQKQIQTLLASYGIPMQKSGKLLGEAFAKGLDQAAAAVTKSAKKLAEIVASYLKLKSPAERGPLSDLDKWWKPMGPMLAKQMNGSALAGAAAGMAGGGAAMAPRMATAGGGGATGQPLVVQMTVDGRVIGEASYPHILVIDKRHGGRMLNHGAPALS